MLRSRGEEAFAPSVLSSSPAVFKLGSADRRVPTGSARGFRKVVILFVRFLTIYDPYVFKFAHISQSLSLSALRGSVAVVWHDRLSVDVS